MQFPLTPVRARALTGDANLVALAVSAYSLANLVGNLLAGLVVDRFPGRLVMAAGLALGGLAFAWAGAAGDVWGLAAALALNGLALSVVTPAAFALLAGHVAPASRARSLASSGASIGLAALVGPPVAGVLGDRLGQGAAFQVAGGFLLAVAVLALFVPRGGARDEGAPPGLGDLVAIGADRRLWPGFAGAFALMAANGGLVFALPPHVKALGHPGATIGLLFSAFALTAIAVFVSRLGRWAYTARPAAVMGLGAAAIALALAALAAVTALPLMAAALLLYGLGFGLLYTASLAALVAGAPEARRGTAFGLFYALFSLGAAVGPFWVARAAVGGWPVFAAAALLPALFALGFAGLAWRGEPGD